MRSTTTRFVLLARAVSVVLAVVTLAFGGHVASRGVHGESAFRLASAHHEAAFVAIASAHRTPEAKRLDFSVALDLPVPPAPWRIHAAIISREWAWSELAPASHDVRLPVDVVARGPPSC